MDTRITRKQRRILITVFSIMLILLSSCDPVSYPTLPEQQIETNNESIAMPNSTNSVYVAFKPVLGAVGYGYTISAADSFATYAAEETIWPSFNYDKASGLVYFTVDNTVTGSTYNITIFAKTADEKISEIKKLENYTVPNADITNEVPTAYISKISENSIEISIEKEISAGNMDYLAVYTDTNGVEQEEVFEDIPFTIENFTSGDIIIYQKYKAEADFNTNAATKTLTVKAEDAKTTMTLTISGSDFTVTGAPSDTTIEIRKITANGEVNIASAKAGEVINYPVFDYGQFKAVAISADGADGAEVAVSNAVYSVLPVVIKTETARQQSYVFTFEVTPGVDLTAAKVMTSIGNASISQVKNIVTVTVTDLSSRQAYNSNVYFTIADAGRVIIPVEFKTKSFAGTYTWTAQNHKTGKYAKYFGVIVEEAPAESDYTYYIYADPAVEGNTEEIRLLPLLDNLDTPEYNQSGQIDYNGASLYQRSYKWNNEKWNSSSFIPLYWYINKEKTEIKNDSYSSEVFSAVDMGGSITEAPTTTKFTFVEEDGKQSLVFFNKVGGSLAFFGNMFLYKNPDVPNKGDAPYTFTLSYTGAAE